MATNRDALFTRDPLTGRTAGLVDQTGLVTPIGSYASPAVLFNLFGTENNSGQTVGASDVIMDAQIPAMAPFYGVKLVYANYNTAAAMTMDGAKVAPTAVDLTAAGNTLSWSSFVTFSGSQTATVPQAKTGAGGQIVPGIAVSDFVPVTSIARTDVVGAPYLLRVRSHVLANSIAFSIGGTHGATLNAASFNPGLKYANYNPVDTLANLTTNVSSTLSPSSAIEPIAVIFFYSSSVESLAAFGDSVIQGAGSATSHFAGPADRLTFLSYGTSRQISAASFASSGQTTLDSNATLKNYINAGATPTYVLFKSWSVNDGLTQALVDKSWASVVDTLEFLRQKSITPVLLTAPPTSGVPWAMIKVVNARVMALPAWVVKVDVATALNDPSNDGNLRAVYDSGDHTHPTDAANLLMAQMILAALR